MSKLMKFSIKTHCCYRRQLCVRTTDIKYRYDVAEQCCWALGVSCTVGIPHTLSATTLLKCRQLKKACLLVLSCVRDSNSTADSMSSTWLSAVLLLKILSRFINLWEIASMPALKIKTRLSDFHDHSRAIGNGPEPRTMN